MVPDIYSMCNISVRTFIFILYFICYILCINIMYVNTIHTLNYTKLLVLYDDYCCK
jgi:hypothetical protein